MYKKTPCQAIPNFFNFYKKGYIFEGNVYSSYYISLRLGHLKHDSVENVESSFGNSKKALEKACGPNNKKFLFGVCVHYTD